MYRNRTNLVYSRKAINTKELDHIVGTSIAARRLRSRRWMTRLRSDFGFSILETVIVVGLIGVISAVAVPMFGNALAHFRVTGDARSVSNAIAVAKMRAASNFSRVRLYVDLDAEAHHIEAWDKETASWITEGGLTYLS